MQTSEDDNIIQKIERPLYCLKFSVNLIKTTMFRKVQHKYIWPPLPPDFTTLFEYNDKPTLSAAELCTRYVEQLHLPYRGTTEYISELINKAMRLYD
jgi:hypothetical protein